MDELFGKVVRDSATGYHGEVYSPANSLVNGVIGDAFSTISSGNYIELPKSAYFPEGTEQVSLSFWAFVSGGELKDQTLLHASSAVGTHMKVQLPAEDGALHWMTGSGGVYMIPPIRFHPSTISGFIGPSNWIYFQESLRSTRMETLS